METFRKSLVQIDLIVNINVNVQMYVETMGGGRIDHTKSGRRENGEKNRLELTQEYRWEVWNISIEA